MRLDILTKSTIQSLAAAFLSANPFYANVGITSKEVLKAYSCKIEAIGSGGEDGWNPIEYKLIEERMGGQVKTEGRYIMWSVLAEAFHDWLLSTILRVGKEI